MVHRESYEMVCNLRFPVTPKLGLAFDTRNAAMLNPTNACQNCVIELKHI